MSLMEPSSGFLARLRVKEESQKIPPLNEGTLKKPIENVKADSDELDIKVNDPTNNKGE